MALISCYECETEISDKAKSCPKCGAPARNSGQNLINSKPTNFIESVPNSSRVFLVLALVLFLFGFLDEKESNELKRNFENCEDLNGEYNFITSSDSHPCADDWDEWWDHAITDNYGEGFYVFGWLSLITSAICFFRWRRSRDMIHE